MPSPLLLKATLLLISMLTIMAGTPVSPALPKIAAAFAGAPNGELLSRLVLTMPALFTVVAAPIAGLIADRHGRRPLALVAIALYILGGVSGFFGQTLYQILAGRALLGLAVGGCTTAATALISDYFRGQERLRLLGFQAAFSTAGGVLFITLGGFLAEIGWRYTFLIYLVALPVLVLAFRVLREPPRPDRGSDRSAANKLPVGFLVVLYGITLLGIMGFFTAPIQMPFFLQRDYGLGAAGTGIVLSLATVFASLSSYRFAQIRGYLSYGAMLPVMFLTMGSSYLVVGLTQQLWVVVLALCVSGLSAGLLLPAVNSWVAEITTTYNRGRAIGFISTAFFLGQFLAPLVMAPLLAWLDTYGAFFRVLGGILLAVGVVMAILAGPLNRHAARLRTVQPDSSGWR